MENCEEKDVFEGNPIKKLMATSQEKSGDCKIIGPRIADNFNFMLGSMNELKSKRGTSSLLSSIERKPPGFEKISSISNSKASRFLSHANELTVQLKSQKPKTYSIRRSISNLQKSRPSIRLGLNNKKRKTCLLKANIINLEDMLFRQKLDRFIRNLRTHSSVNDMNRLSLEKLKIINDLSGFPNKLLEDGNFSEVYKENRNLWKKTILGRRKKSRTDKIISILKINYQKIIHYIEILLKFVLCLIEENIPVLKPFSKFKFFWDFLMLFLTAWNLFSFTLKISFKTSLQESFSFSVPLLNRDDSFLGFQIVCLILYSIDILMKFNTSYYSDGESVQDRRKIIKNYIATGLFFDLLGIIPFWQFLRDGEGGMNHFFLLFKIYPLLIFFRNINEALLNIEGKLEASYYLTKLLLTVLFFCHIFACLWHFQAVNKEDKERSWLVEQNLVEASWTERYLRSLYFVVVTMTTVGYGDIHPTNTTEYLISMSNMLIGSGLIGFSINSIGAIQKKKNKRENDFRTKIQVLNAFFKKNNVSDTVKIRVRKYLEYICKIEDSVNDKKSEEIMKELPNTLREEILTQTRAAGLEALFLGKFKSTTIKKLAHSVTLAQYSKEEWILLEGEDDGNNLYIIVKGAADLILNEGKANKSKCIKFDSKKAGEPIGAFAFMTDQPKNFSVKAASNCSLLKISKTKFIEILKEDPEDYETYCWLRDRIFLYRDTSALGRRCKSCGNIDHLIIRCPFLSYVPFKSILISKHLHSQPQKRRHFKRKSKTNLPFTQTLLKANDVRKSLEQFKEEKPLENIPFLRAYSEINGNDAETFKEYRSLATETLTRTKTKEEKRNEAQTCKEFRSFASDIFSRNKQKEEMTLKEDCDCEPGNKKHIFASTQEKDRFKEVVRDPNSDDDIKCKEDLPVTSLGKGALKCLVQQKFEYSKKMTVRIMMMMRTTRTKNFLRILVKLHPVYLREILRSKITIKRKKKI